MGLMWQIMLAVQLKGEKTTSLSPFMSAFMAAIKLIFFSIYFMVARKEINPTACLPDRVWQL
jgi:hypothetical protein